ncbi:MAG TPA: MFS transporter [Bryobacteraceae bacterium]
MPDPPPARTLQGSVAIGLRARRRVAFRVLPFVFVLYVVNYVDRVNVSFANLRMSADLGFNDYVYGLGVGMFYLTYVLFEIPGALIVERWSAKKWIARIMISWGAITILTGFIHSAAQFYAVRFLLGAAEASFFPGMIVYLTHWCPLRERSFAIACLYAAVPSASLIGAPIAGWVLGVHWLSLSGWRWLFILEGIPAIVLGVVTLFYLTDWPSQARWLPPDERDWLRNELAEELAAKKKMRSLKVLEAFCDGRVLLLAAVWLLSLSGYLGGAYWMPTFIKRLSGFSDRTVTSLLILPALMGIAGTLLNGWHSDRISERRWHAAIPLLLSGLLYGLAITFRHDFYPAIIFILLGSGIIYALYPVFWAMPTLILSGSAAAASFALINSFGQLGGLAGPYLIGILNDRTHSLAASFLFITLAFVAAGSLVLCLRIGNPLEASQGAPR